MTNTSVLPIKNTVKMNKRLIRGELLVEVQDKLMYAEENTMRNMREPYMMAVTFPTGRHHNILRFDGTTDEGGGMTKAVDGEGDVRAQVPIDDGGDDITIPVDDSGGAAPVQVEEGGGSVPVDDEEGAAHVRVPVDDCGGDGPVQGGGMAEAADDGGHIRFQVPVDVIFSYS